MNKVTIMFEIKKMPIFDTNGFDDQMLYVIDNIEYKAKTTPYIVEKLRKLKRKNDKIKLLNGKRTGYFYQDGKRVKIKKPSIEEILKTKNNSKKQTMINMLWEEGNYYERESLIDNGLIKNGDENMDVSKELIKVANFLRTERDYGCVDKSTKKAMRVGETKEIGDIRIHLFSTSLKIWDLTNAGRKGKIVDYFWVGSRGRDEDDLYSLAQILEKCTDYKKALKLTKDFVADKNNLDFGEDKEKGWDVLPKGFKKFEFRNSKISIKCDTKGFTIRDLEDRNNEPTAIDTNKMGPRLLFKWLNDNSSKLNNMDFHDILDKISKEGIAYHYYCAMD